MSGLKDLIASIIGKASEVEAVEAVSEIAGDESPEIVITHEFQEAFKLIETGARFSFITGRAGTGKTTFLELIKKKLKSYAVVAPTGVAALNVGGQTIHSFFRLAPGPIDFSKIKRVKNRIAYQALKTLIIDEISMVRADLLDAIDLMLRKNGFDEDLPFGGVQVVAVGDLYQLPPIVATEEESAFITNEYKTPFFFGAKALKDIELKKIEFTKVFRQTEEKFINLLNNIREGKQLEDSLKDINERVIPIGDKAFEGIMLTPTNDIASKINTDRLLEIKEEIRNYFGEIVGEFRVDKNKLPAPFELNLKVGARVMFVKNDKGKKWVNGTIGTVTELGYTFVEVEIKDQWGERKVRTEADTWENLKYEYNADENAVVATKVGSYKQIPLTLAWAVTIHKSQGKTFDRVHIELGRGAFAEGQVYVALSRCRTLEGVTLERAVRKEDIYLNFDVIGFGKGKYD